MAKRVNHQRHPAQGVRGAGQAGVIRPEVRGGKVRLGINAPRHVSVHRKEIYEIILREKADGEKPSGT